MKRVVASLIGLLSAMAFGQTIIPAEKELFATIPVGGQAGQVNYRNDDEGFWSPNGPLVSPSGILYFVPTYSRNSLLIWNNGKFASQPRPDGWPKFLSTTYLFASQNGRTSMSLTNRFMNWDHEMLRQMDWGDVASDPSYVYLTSFGGVLENPGAGTFEALVVQNDGSSKLYSGKDATEWLASSGKGFSVELNSQIFYNGFSISIKAPVDSRHAGRFVGRLLSGHAVWTDSQNGEERFLVIARPDGHTELEVEIPWGRKDSSESPRFYNWSLGPWGEMYCLLPPSDLFVLGQGKYGTAYQIQDFAKIAKPAELVVVRNYLKHFGRLNDSNVRLRKDPSTSADIVGTFPAKTGFRIIEKSTKQETIGGKSDYWYHVRLLDGKEGWFFGSFVATLYNGPGKLPPWPNVAEW